MVGERTGPHSPVKLSGAIPPLAESFHQRPETGLDLRAGLYPGDTVVLTHGEDTAATPAAQGGTGKTQIAVAFSHALWGGRAVDALVWVPATSREAIVTGFARAARTVGAADQALPAEAAAGRFTGWLAHTRRPWALILDDLASLADLEDLWPSGLAGQVVITTGLPAAIFPAGPRIAPVGGFSRREVLAYLSARLTDFPDQRAEALELGADLDGLPLALAQAAAVMTLNRLSCREYRGRLGERREHMSAIWVDGVSPAVLATWSLAAESAHELPPAGAAWPALALAAMLDSHGIPGAVLTSPAGCSYIAGRPSTADLADQTLVRAAMTNLARAGLVSIEPGSKARTVRMHPSVQTAVRAYLPPADFEQAVLAAAEALLQAWPETDESQVPLEHLQAGQAPLVQALRDCAAALQSADSAAPHPAAGGAFQGAQPQQSVLWKPEAHPVLFRRGLSLEADGLAESAIAYWQGMLVTSAGLLGNDHVNAVTARDRLAAAYESAGRFGDAISVYSTALADRERNQGPEHPDTLTARGNLARAYSSAWRLAEAVVLYEQVVATAGRQLGPAAPGHPGRAGSPGGRVPGGRPGQGGADRIPDAAGRRRAAARGAAPGHAGHPGEPGCRLPGQRAVQGGHRTLQAVRGGHRGGGRPRSLASRSRRAPAWPRPAAGAASRRTPITLYQRVLADHERIAGPDHPDTITARADLAFAYRSAGHMREAIAAYERTLADRERVQGRDHADTRSARAHLAAAYQRAGRLGDAIYHFEQALADSEQMLGPGDLETLTARSSLAAAHFAAGRRAEVIPLLQRTLADSERYLGPDHPLTAAARDNLEAVSRN